MNPPLVEVRPIDYHGAPYHTVFVDGVEWTSADHRLPCANRGDAEEVACYIETDLIEEDAISESKIAILEHDGDQVSCVATGEVSLEKIYGEPVTRTRASRIEPVHPAKRLCFRVLRKLGGDRGRLADWTRRWRGPWRATLLSNGETFTHFQRSECLRWEIARLTHTQP